LTANISSQEASNQAPARISMRRPDDWHLHLRDGDAMAAVLPATARQFARAIVMPNLKPPVTTVEMAHAYRERILAALPAGMQFEPLMTLYLTDETTAEEIFKAAESPFVQGVKLYPAGATTNSQAGVSALSRCTAALAALEKTGLPFLVHGEVTDPHVDVFDREAVFIDEVMVPVRRDFPGLRVVFEHITTRQAAQYVTSESRIGGDGRPNLAATLTPQHLLFNRNALFKGGLQPHWYCLPVLKREEHRQALLQAATSGLPQFFLGTDSAPHARHLKEMACGCAGCYSAPVAMELYAQAFESAGALDHLERFASINGPTFYGLPVNEERITLERQAWTVPAELPFADGRTIVPFLGGETLPWKMSA
jgi:dihydroorotase